MNLWKHARLYEKGTKQNQNSAMEIIDWSLIQILCFLLHPKWRHIQVCQQWLPVPQNQDLYY